MKILKFAICVLVFLSVIAFDCSKALARSSGVAENLGTFESGQAKRTQKKADLDQIQNKRIIENDEATKSSSQSGSTTSAGEQEQPTPTE